MGKGLPAPLQIGKELKLTVINTPNPKRLKALDCFLLTSDLNYKPQKQLPPGNILQFFLITDQRLKLTSGTRDICKPLYMSAKTRPSNF